MSYTVQFEETPRIIPVALQEAESEFSTDMEISNTVVVGNSDHAALINRDADDQHPIKAITKLKETLEERPSEALSNQDIENLLKAFV